MDLETVMEKEIEMEMEMEMQVGRCANAARKGGDAG